LLAKVAKRNSALRKYFVTQHRNKINKQGFFPLKPTHEKEIPKQRDTDWFVLTQDAFEYLKNIPDPLALIQRCSQFAIKIDKNVLEFFRSHEELKCLDDLQQLWDLGVNPLPLTMDISAASRVLSIMKQYYKDKDERAKIIICLQDCEPLAVIYHLGTYKFKLNELQYLADKLKQQPSADRKPFISALAKICGDFTERMQAIDWLIKIDAAKRKKIVKRYKVATRLFAYRGEANLERIREHPELLDTDFVYSAVTLKKFTQ